MNNNKEYKILAFINDSDLKNIILFGHLNGLDLLFQDNYSIKYKYDKQDINNTNMIKENINILKIYNTVNKFIDEFNKNINDKSKDSYQILERSMRDAIRENNLKLIHRYITDISPELFNDTHAKIRVMKNYIKNNIPDTEKTKESILYVLDKML